ncbi:hypothetical protein Q4I30_003872 [Leishmania utingensis]|uniref:Uncharacterized protein n=1 Tax=Leishmania utingensis TaxID=653362 RepID=A0AAW3AIE3_9TRYP
MRRRGYSKAPPALSLASPVLTRRSDPKVLYQQWQPQHSLPCLRVVSPLGKGNGSDNGRDPAVRHTLDTSHAGSLADISVSDIPDSSRGVSSPQEEALRRSAEHLARRVRQVQAQETRQRTLLLKEAAELFADMILHHGVCLDIAASCAVLQASRNTHAQAEAQQAQQWQLQILRDTLNDTVTEEKEARKSLELAALSVRRSLVQLHRAEAQPLLQREAFFRLMHAEHVRRAFLHREEARAVEAMGIPYFISLPCRSVPAEAAFEPRKGGKADVKEGVTELNKIDLMAQERCPFQCAADCPYMTQRTRQLGKRWAAAVTSCEDTRVTTASLRLDRRGASLPPVTRASRQWQVPGLGITEVGKQRVRNAMMMGHYSATAEFLPGLRL